MAAGVSHSSCILTWAPQLLPPSAHLSGRCKFGVVWLRNFNDFSISDLLRRKIVLLMNSERESIRREVIMA
jgi:hypothetical protein